MSPESVGWGRRLRPRNNDCRGPGRLEGNIRPPEYYGSAAHRVITETP